MNLGTSFLMFFNSLIFAILKAFETIFDPFPCPTVFPKKNNIHARSVGFLAFSNAQILTLGEAVTSLLLSLGGSREGSKQNRWEAYPPTGESLLYGAGKCETVRCGSPGAAGFWIACCLLLAVFFFPLLLPCNTNIWLTQTKGEEKNSKLTQEWPPRLFPSFCLI